MLLIFAIGMGLGTIMGWAMASWHTYGVYEQDANDLIRALRISGVEDRLLRRAVLQSRSFYVHPPRDNG